MSNVDMGWSRFLPSAQTIPAQVPNWERPRFNAVGAMQSAQKYLADQQAMDFARQEQPISLALQRARLAAAEHDVSRMGVGDRIEDLRLSQAEQDAATANELRPLQTEATKADLARRIQTGEITDEQIKRATTVAEGIRYVFKFPDGSPEQAAAWDEFVRQAGARGIFRPEEVEAWRKHGPDKQIAREALSIDDTIKDALKPTRSAYADLPVAQQIALDNQAVREVDAEMGKVDTFATEEKKAEFAAARKERLEQKRQEIYARHGVTGMPAGVPGSIVKDKADYEGKVDREIKKAADGKTAVGQEQPQSKAKGKTRSLANGIGSSRDKPVNYGGPPDDEQAQKDWFTSLPVGTWFVNPATGDILPKNREAE